MYRLLKQAEFDEYIEVNSKVNSRCEHSSRLPYVISDDFSLVQFW